VYAVGIPACPQCGGTDYTDNEGGIVAKASAEGGATHYVAQGDPVPGDLPDGVRLVGPGAPVPDEPEPEAAEPDDPEAEAEGEAGAGPGSISGDEEEGPPDYMAYRVTDLRELSRDRGLPVTGAKADLAAALAQWDAGHPDGPATGGVVDPDVALQVGE
jgi:hypothetical protein